eukprot:scaffold33715_cov39-Cyclotella_meneghiniana.AAC.5
MLHQSPSHHIIIETIFISSKNRGTLPNTNIYTLWKHLEAGRRGSHLLRFTLADIRSMEAEFDEAVDYDEEQMIGNGYHSLEDDADEFDEYNEIDYVEDNDEMDF